MARTKRSRQRYEPQSGSAIQRTAAAPPSEPNSSTGAVATSVPFYRTPYPGLRYWAVGVRVDPERGTLPFQAKNFGQIEFFAGPQRIVNDNGYLGLERARKRLYMVRIPWRYVERALRKISYTVIRWQRRTRDISEGESSTVWAANVVGLSARHKILDPATRMWSTGDESIHRMIPGDVPVAKYLVLVPRSFLRELDLAPDSWGDLVPEDVPTIYDLDPSFAPSAEVDKEIEGDETDEPWW